MASTLFSFCDVNRYSNDCGTFSSPACFVSQGRIKHIHDNIPKNALEPSTKVDCHLSKSGNRVTSLLSYRAFELTQVNMGSFSFTYCMYCVIKVMLYISFLDRICTFWTCLSCCLVAIFFRVCIWWDQSAAQACVPLCCAFLQVQRQGGCGLSYDFTQVCIPAGNSETQQVSSGGWRGLPSVVC